MRSLGLHQLRRSCASIAANLAEGCARGGDLDFARFVNVQPPRRQKLTITCCCSRLTIHGRFRLSTTFEQVPK